ncbi:unnamed protein product [Amoebophrya sp. A25]|nr:unnamed protein product [Amoebophrya sp. A25]|eukprot:GSA25T00027993001.1
MICKDAGCSDFAQRCKTLSMAGKVWGFNARHLQAITVTEVILSCYGRNRWISHSRRQKEVLRESWTNSNHRRSSGIIVFSRWHIFFIRHDFVFFTLVGKKQRKV